MKYICEIVDSNKVSESPCRNKEPQDLSEQQKILAELNGQRVVAHDGKISLLNLHNVPAWECPFEIEGRPNEVFVSEDRLLLTTLTKNYHAWGFLGPAFLIDMTNGSLVAELRGESGAAFNDGSFILGLEGYDYFNTWLYDRNGKLVQTWRSYGHYIVGENNDVRVLEKDRQIPTQSRLVRLKLDGQIEKGPLLNESQVGKPLSLGDKSLLFVDCGTIRIIDVELKEQYKKILINIPQRDAWRFHSYIYFKDCRIVVNIYERSEKQPIEYTKHSWLLELNYEH